jgi:hypothetical protein
MRCKRSKSFLLEDPYSCHIDHVIRIVETKMLTPPSAGTTNAAEVDQAARNVACIVECTGRTSRTQGQLTTYWSIWQPRLWECGHKCTLTLLRSKFQMDKANLLTNILNTANPRFWIRSL